MNKIKLQVTQLDGRHKGLGHWTHRVEFLADYSAGYYAGAREEVMRNFVEVRTALWEAFGPGCDREELYRIARATKAAPEWGWWDDTKGHSTYIYFNRGPILTWFLMRS